MKDLPKTLKLNVEISEASSYQLKMWKSLRGHSNMNAALDDFITYHTFKNSIAVRSLKKYDGTYNLNE